MKSSSRENPLHGSKDGSVTRSNSFFERNSLRISFKSRRSAMSNATGGSNSTTTEINTKVSSSNFLCQNIPSIVQPSWNSRFILHGCLIWLLKLVSPTVEYPFCSCYLCLLPDIYFWGMLCLQCFCCEIHSLSVERGWQRWNFILRNHSKVCHFWISWSIRLKIQYIVHSMWLSRHL